jgi:putative transposase
MDLRERIAGTVEEGDSCHAAAERFAVAPSTVIKLMERLRTTGSLAPGQMGGWKDYALAAHEELVRALIAARPDMTLAELGEALAGEGIQVGRSAIARFLKDRELTLKKSRSTPPSRAGQTSRPRGPRGAISNRE